MTKIVNTSKVIDYLMFYLITFGKLKDKNLKSLEEGYLKRLTDLKFKIIELKDKNNSPSQNNEQLINKIQDLSKGKKYILILLDETGELQTSEKFATKISHYLTQNHQRPLFFCIGPSYGHNQETKNLGTELISLSPMTFPHQLARLLFVEQIYRAQSILQKHPYHHS